MISFLVMFFEDMPHVVADLRDRMCDVSFPPWKKRLLNLANSSSVFSVPKRIY